MRPGRRYPRWSRAWSTGADSIADMAVLRHGGMGRLFTGVRAPSTLGTFLRAFRFGHVRQLDAVAARFLTGLTRHAPLISTGRGGHLRRYRRHHPVHLRVRQAGHRLRVLRGQGTERAAGHGVDRVVGAGDRGDPAAEGIGELRAGRGPAGRRRAGHHPVLRRDRDGGAAGGQRVLRPGRDRRRPPGRGAVLDHRPQGPGGHRGDQRDPGRCVDHDPLPESGVRRAARAVGVRRRGRRDPFHRFHFPPRRPIRSPPG